MRYATVVLTPVDGGFHPADRAVAADPGLTREAIYHVNRLTDGTGVMLSHVRGDERRAAEILAAQPDVLDWDIAEMDDGLHIYVHVEPNDTLETLLQLVHEYELVLDTPIVCVQEGGLEASAVGEDAVLQAVIDAIPEEIHVELVEMGDYQSGHRQLASLLTDRQREILNVAVSAGYYEEPRQVTYRDIAEKLNLSPATVGEHLRKIEGKVLREIS